MEDIFKQQTEWLSSWQEQQQKLTKQYATWGESMTQGFPGVGKQQIPTNFEDMLKAQQELVEQFSGFGTDLQQKLQQLWGDKLPAELLKSFNFNFMQEFYKSWLGNMNFPGGMQNPFMGGQNWADPSKFLNNFMKQEHPFFSTFSNNNMADEFQQLFGLLKGSGLPGGDIYSQMFTSYQGFFNQLTDASSSQGFDKLLETFSTWKDQLDKHLLAPKVGINRESTQDISKAVSLSFDYFQAVASMAKVIEETSRKSGNRFQAKLVERSLNNEPPLKFSEFSSLWTKENEAVFLDVFGTEEFAKTQGEFAAAGMRLKIQLNTLAENVLDKTPIALKRDVDLAAGEILQLKRALRKSRKQQQELTAEVKAAQEYVAVNEQRFQKLEESLAKAQTNAKTAQKAAEASVAKQSKEIEETLKKVQVLKKEVENAAKSSVVKKSKPISKTAASTDKKATSPKSPKKPAVKKTASTKDK